MYRLNILLFNLFDWHEVHRRSAGCFDDRQRIIGIVLVGLYKRFDELGANQLNRVTTSLEDSRPVIGSPTGLHYDSAGGQSCRIGGKLVSRQTLLHNRLAGTVGAIKLKSVFGNINAQYANSHVDLPSKVEVLQF
jgi:hypothetical protein